ncbi:helix-turn-helix transcriptional regulator [Cellulosilyticum sp. ST5]|uniref:helix-turn-helix domain-containing protein n=1 Tax=Cellulosilyticum sp. ST5 TaxID=3055805 RepID=UPI0039777EEF
MTIVDRIRMLCINSGMTLTGLETELGIGRGIIKRWEKSSPNMDNIQKVADFFHVSVDYLLGREEKSSSLELPPNIRAAARGLLDLSEEDRDLAINMINSLSRKGKEAKDS